MRGLQVYLDMSEQLCELFGEEYKEPVHQSFFYELMERIWTKYLQAFFFEMVVQLKCKEIRLHPDEFGEDMPESWFDNLTDFALFEDYLTSDMQIEVCRALKLRTVQMLVQKETQLSKELDKHADRFETKLDRQQKEITEI